MDDRKKPRPKPEHLDIISDVTWTVELEPEVEEWLDTLSPKEFALTLPHIERLAELGNRLRMPVSKPLGERLFGLRFDLGPVAWRIPSFLRRRSTDRPRDLFRKQRMNERTEIARARAAMARCINEGHTAEED